MNNVDASLPTFINRAMPTRLESRPCTILACRDSVVPGVVEHHSLGCNGFLCWYQAQQRVRRVVLPSQHNYTIQTSYHVAKIPCHTSRKQWYHQVACDLDLSSLHTFASPSDTFDKIAKKIFTSHVFPCFAEITISFLLENKTRVTSHDGILF